jgi:hypothetical protein
MQGGGDDRQENGALARLRRLVAAEASDGLQLSVDIQNNPICSVSLDETIPGITVIWKRYATSAQFRFVHEAVIDMLTRHKVEKILGDDTELPTIYTEDQGWIVQNWMPRACAAGLRAAASKQASHFFGKLAIESIQSLAPRELKIQSFDNLDDAKRWLQAV